MDISNIALVSTSALQPPAADVSLTAGYNASMSSDIAAFENSLSKVEGSGGTAEAVARAMALPLDDINQRASSLAKIAESAIGSGNELSPGEIVALTVKSQEFMFHSQLTSNVANRTADGIQQLFRQQG